MEILNDIEIIDLALYIKKEKTLILTDLHLGLEEHLNAGGILIPMVGFKRLIEKLKKILKTAKKINLIIINGDIKHEFGKISKSEWKTTLNIIDFLQENCPNLIFVQGNHDRALIPIAEKRGIQVVDHIIEKKILIIHGDKEPDDDVMKKVDTIIIGHEHPAISIVEGARIEKYKCYLLGNYKNKNLIVQPSLNLINIGTDIVNEKTLSPFLDTDISNFRVYIVGDTVYEFGSVKKFMVS